MARLLTRDEFREGVFERDNHTCLFCDKPAQDAHHIMERRLFADGGYYLENGASVCGEHHMLCEQTVISTGDCREAAGIAEVVLPDHLYRDQEYDKWGNPVLPNGQRLRGELFWDPSVQKVLRQGQVLDLFTHHVKYPRTYHLPWSPGLTKDDRQHRDMSNFQGREVVMTLKMDGENTTMYQDHIHARSVDSGGHLSRNWVKGFHAQRQGDIPHEWRICGENLYAKHSIAYDKLPSYFLGFSVWNDRNECLSWDETLEWFDLLDIIPVAVLYRGIYDEKRIKDLEKDFDFDRDEGYVLRVTDSLSYGEFRNCVGKFVRKDHVQTAKHWFRGQVITPNKLKNE